MDNGSIDVNANKISYVFLHDGSFDGFLSCVYHSYKEKIIPVRIRDRALYQQGLLDFTVVIETLPAHSEKIDMQIQKRISKTCLDRCYLLHLSEREDKWERAYHYIKTGFKIGRDVDESYGDKYLMDTIRFASRVGGEVHKLTGFIRFELMEGNIYYAAISPDNNILELLSPHFADRFADQKMIIHDRTRGLASVISEGQWAVYPIESSDIPDHDKKEKETAFLWKKFYDTIAIKERLNSKLRRQLMPRRYWKNITELK